MISKELLSEILQQDVNGVFYYEDNLIWFEIDAHESNINIYELAHKCKEWAWYENNIRVSSFFINIEFKTSKELQECNKAQAVISDENSRIIDFFDATSETEAIFKACEWILEQKTKDERV